MEARLTTPVGSRVSHPGDQIRAVIIAPVPAGPEHLFLQGATVEGSVERVQRLGLGIKQGAAELQVRFRSIQLPNGRSFPLAATISAIETARERVDPQGTVVGIDPAANLSSGLSFLMTTVLVHSDLEPVAIAVKIFAARSPDSEIYLPAGSEIVLRTLDDVSLDDHYLSRQTPSALSTSDAISAERLLNALPEQRAEVGLHRASDLINVLLIGSEEDVDAAFRAAGWAGENRHSVLALYRLYHSMVQRMGYRMAPMSRLTFNGRPATKAYQKSLDTLTKRHHIRLWKEANSNVWLGAASEDIGLTVRHMHVTHTIDHAIDNERAKIVNDLWFTGCVTEASLLPRQTLEPAVENGAAIHTDGDVAVLRLGHCSESGASPAAPLVTAHERTAMALRAVRDDLLRANPVTLVCTLARSVRSIARSQTTVLPTIQASTYQRPSVADEKRDELACSQPSSPNAPCSVFPHLN